MDKQRHKCSRCFGWEELSDLEEAVMDMACAVVPNGEYPGLVKITVEYLPSEN